jgi:hypothetical protein
MRPRRSVDKTDGYIMAERIIDTDRVLATHAEIGDGVVTHRS